MFCCTLLYVHSSIAIILMGKRELIALLNLSSWCLVVVERLFLTVPQGCLQFVIVVFPDHTHLLFLRAQHRQRISNIYIYLCVSYQSVGTGSETSPKNKNNIEPHPKEFNLKLPSNPSDTYSWNSPNIKNLMNKINLKLDHCLDQRKKKAPKNALTVK